jgi:hypothetical protein
VTKDIFINQSQVSSLIAFHLIRFWPEAMPPNLENILSKWIQITAKDFDDFDQQEIGEKELKSYIETTLCANTKFRDVMEKIDFKRFIKAICKDINEEIKELHE